MSATLGKRKREVVVAARDTRRGTDSDNEQPTAHTTLSDVERDIFRKYFESTFEPLPESHAPTPSLLEDEENARDFSDEEDVEWEGLSEPEQENTTVEIIEHRTFTTDGTEEAELQRKQFKTFMTSAPPKNVEQMPPKKPDKQADQEDLSEELNLKHDLDLQRLLKESHLLEEAKTASTPGRHRHKAVDMRLQSLGSKGSIFHQEKMPLTHRRGITAKAATREGVRRREARENGIILERPTMKSKSSPARRERGVDVPAVGRFQGGTLKLSKRDIVDIQGPSRPGGRGKRGRR
ncbi:hypothetical protein A1O3_08052 [Capronia epimyces CBS 606.96]|uniref:Uncharacterized protein n=1 Tax=Capronia epimyces CBS 606.96 TaxID=1182542 RepID=W9YBN2_9EURO|nr:uncharacterized protein A1O3_08052 [Capronia epimyces CBS 606.96]EXJ79769.1 hypothetical protein A1O3_08052 [Capronia epimyces CBS 606.96]